jgi:hypothetical protein
MNRPTIALLHPSGAPVKIDIAVRASESMPSRLKVHFRTDERKPHVEAPDGTVVAVQTEKGRLCPDFRLEMN